MAEKDNPRDDQPRTFREILKPFHASIAQWRGEGKTLREIADRLKSSAGVITDHNKVGRYCNENNILAEPSPKLPTSSQTAPPRKPQDEAAPAVPPPETAPANDEAAADAEPESPTLFPEPEAVAPPPVPNPPAVRPGQLPPEPKRFPTALDLAADTQAQSAPIVRPPRPPDRRPAVDAAADRSPPRPTPAPKPVAPPRPVRFPPPPPPEDFDEEDEETEGANKQLSPVVQQPYVANKPPREQAQDLAAAAASGPSWQDVDAYLDIELPNLRATSGTPEFHAVAAQGRRLA